LPASTVPGEGDVTVVLCLPEAGLMADGTRLAPSWCPFGHRVGGRRTRTV